MNRFALPFLAMLVALTACAGGQNLAQIASDAHMIAAGLQSVVGNPTIGAMIAPSDMSRVQAALADLSSVSATLADAPSASAAKPSVAQLVADTNVVVAATARLPLPPPMPAVLQAANVLLPVLEAAVGLPVAASAAANTMSPDSARLVLAATAR